VNIREKELARSKDLDNYVIELFEENAKIKINSIDEMRQENFMLAAKYVKKNIFFLGIRRYIDNINFFERVIKEKLCIIEGIRKMLDVENVEVPITKHVDDSDDPPIPTDFKTYQFIECDNYLTIDGFKKFNLDFVIRTTKKEEYRSYTEDTLLNDPNIPSSDYI
jgi:hypothetical protein